MDIRELVFKSRGFTPMPLALVLLYQSNMTWWGGIIGLIIALSGEWLRISSVRYAGGRTRARKVGAKDLCIYGPFSHVRNPLYLGNMIIYMGMLIFAIGPWFVPILVISLTFFITQYSLIISLEEETLLRIFGSDYKQYCSNVPRLIPKFKSWKKQAEVGRLSWKKVLHAERRTLQIFLLFIAAVILKEIIINIFHVFT